MKELEYIYIFKVNCFGMYNYLSVSLRLRLVLELSTFNVFYKLLLDMLLLS